MRLSSHEVATIKATAAEVFGADAVVRLFGSRVDDDARGGDIDLHIQARPPNATIKHEVRFRSELWKRLDEPQVDVVLTAHGKAPRWIDRAALRKGIML